MAGIGSGITQQVRPAAPAQAQPTQGSPRLGDPEPNVSPEEQVQYDKLVNNALEVIMPEGSDGPSEQVLAHLQGQFDPQVQETFAQIDPPLDYAAPIDAIAATAVLIVMFLDASASGSGVQIDNEVLFNAGSEIVEQLASVGEAVGIFEISDEDTERAFHRAAYVYSVVGPRVDPEVASAEFGQIVEADKAGRLGEIIPGVAQGEEA